MSFFRNLRSSLTRGRSSSRDTTPVRNSRPGSVISSLNSVSGKRRDSLESHADSLLNRSDTFILDEGDDITPSPSNCSTLEKKSKKSKVLEKFSTFTKRKKTPAAAAAASVSFEHHPSDNATNTYYKWQTDGCNSLDYDSQNDPFNFLYEQQSSLKCLQNNNSSSPADSLKSTSTPSAPTFDSSTYRKGKMPPTDSQKQLKLLKNDIKQEKEQLPVTLKEEEPEEEDDASRADKYKTVTLNSFRKSFREKFLQQQKEAAYNPSWFVEVEPSEVAKNQKEVRESSKENKHDLLIFENDNYRPTSRSPIRDLSSRKAARSATRSPVKRNETFKMERLSRREQQTLRSKTEETTPSIRIEFKNSITPHIPGRMVPVGVAKPMLTKHCYRKADTTPFPHNSDTVKSSNAKTSSIRLNTHSPIRTPWSKTQTPLRTASSNSSTRPGRYQTLVQIRSEKPQQPSPITVSNSRLPTRIQLNNNNATITERRTNITAHSPSFAKHYNSPVMLRSGVTKAQHQKHTYFGDTPQLARIKPTPSHRDVSTSVLRTRPATPSTYEVYKYHTPSSTLFASATTLTTPTSSSSLSTATRTTPSHSISNIHSSSSSHNLYCYPKHYQQHLPPQQHQSRIMVAGQRRSRSPIKIPWR